MKRRVLVIGAAILFALVGTIAVVAYVHRADARAAAGQQPVEVITARAAIPKGTTVATARSAGLLEKDVFPRRAVSDQALRALPESMDRLVAISDIAKGEILVAGRFAPPEEAAPQELLAVPKGKIAVSVQLTDPGRVSDLLRPGDFVTVLHFREINQVHEAHVLLPRVEVLAIGQSTAASPTPSPSPEGGKGSGSSSSNDQAVPRTVVTLAVTAGESAKLAYGANFGELHLGLLGDTAATTKGAGVTDVTVYK